MASLGETKLRNLGDYLGKSATPSALANRFVGFVSRYQAKYVHVKNARMTPFWHIVFVMIGVNYALEYSHLKHSQMRKYH